MKSIRIKPAKALLVASISILISATAYGFSSAATLTNTGNQIFDSACNKTMNYYTSGLLSNAAFTEVSGIAPVHTLADAYWVHNDSGAVAGFYSIDKTGKALGGFLLNGVKAVDWEDIDVGPGPIAGTPYVYIADTGDNDLNRSSVQVYRIAEPNANQGGKAISLNGAEKLTFVYPGGVKRNVEAVFVDPSTGEIYFFEKNDKRKGEVFRAPGNLRAGSVTTLTKLGSLGYSGDGGKTYEKFTGADISPDGTTIALSSYNYAFIYNRTSSATVPTALVSTPCLLPSYKESKGEAIGFKMNGSGIVTVSEGKSQPLHNYDRR